MTQKSEKQERSSRQRGKEQRGASLTPLLWLERSLTCNQCKCKCDKLWHTDKITKKKRKTGAELLAAERAFTHSSSWRALSLFATNANGKCNKLWLLTHTHTQDDTIKRKTGSVVSACKKWAERGLLTVQCSLPSAKATKSHEAEAQCAWHT